MSVNKPDTSKDFWEITDWLLVSQACVFDYKKLVEELLSQKPNGWIYFMWLLKKWNIDISKRIIQAVIQSS